MLYINIDSCNNDGFINRNMGPLWANPNHNHHQRHHRQNIQFGHSWQQREQYYIYNQIIF